ncbi:MAG: nicotinamide riboside transporter PnuC [Bacteroidota bacterium]
MSVVLSWICSNYIEIAASLLGIIGVWLTTRQLIWCWPVGLLNVILSLYVFFASRLYADVILQVFYFVMTLYGWYNWRYGGKGKSVLQVSRITPQLLLVLIIISFFATALTGFLFSKYTDAALPYWDAGVAVWGVLCTWLQARKILENWLIWIITDLVCTGIYFYKELYAFTGLYFFFAVLAAYGFYAWRKDLIKLSAT